MLRTATWCALALALCLAGCARQVRPGPVGDVHAGVLLPTGAPAWEEKPNERFLVAAPVGNQPMPDYPPQYLDSDLEERLVCVDIVVHPDGHVTSARHNREAVECQHGDIEPAFVGRAVEAISGWQFFGAQLCRFPEGVEPSDECLGDGVEIVPLPVRLTYVFAFSQADGEGKVGAVRQVWRVGVRARA